MKDEREYKNKGLKTNNKTRVLQSGMHIANKNYKIIITIETVWFPSISSSDSCSICCLAIQSYKFPGGGIEGEAAVAIENSTKAIIPTLPNALPVYTNDAPVNIPASLAMEKEEEQAKKKPLLWWKLNKKINTIYGDWIDD